MNLELAQSLFTYTQNITRGAEGLTDSRDRCGSGFSIASSFELPTSEIRNIIVHSKACRFMFHR
jgi:hypothetical protein